MRNSDPIPAATRRIVYARDENKCRKCERRKHLHLHHIIPRWEGGSNDPGNLITLCGACHDEWDAIEASTILSLEQWLKIPSVGQLAVILTIDWPKNQTAYEFQKNMLSACKVFNATFRGMEEEDERDNTKKRRPNRRARRAA